MHPNSRPESPTSSTMSIESIGTKVFVRQFGGRGINTSSDTYMLPADAEEHSRLNLQHRIFTLILDSLYAAPDLVKAAMTPRQNNPCSAIDIGTGSGSWAIDFANEFSHATVIGIDLVPPILTGPLPPNCRFEVDDVNLSMDHYAKSFNVVHARGIEPGIKDYEDLLYRLSQILKTNGVLLIVSGDENLYDEHMKPLPLDLEEGHPRWCATQAIVGAAQKITKQRGAATDAKYYWEEFMERNPYLENTGIEDVFIPVGPWMEGLDARCTHIAKLFQEDMRAIIAAFKPLLYSENFDEALLGRWMSVAYREVEEMKPRLFARWRHGWATRNSTDWVPKRDAGTI